MFLLDTNVLSELRKPKPHGGVRSWYGSHTPRSYYVPSIALLEIQAGIELTREQNDVKAEQIERWMDGVVASAVVLGLDEVAARMTAKLMHGRSPALVPDAMIAAIAKVNGLTIATRNVKDFEIFRVPFVNPFAYRE